MIEVELVVFVESFCEILVVIVVVLFILVLVVGLIFVCWFGDLVECLYDW